MVTQEIRHLRTSEGEIRMKLTAYCDSERCGHRRMEIKVNGKYKTVGFKEPTRVVKENVKPHDIQCPDCRSALFWQRDDSTNVHYI